MAGGLREAEDEEVGSLVFAGYTAGLGPRLGVVRFARATLRLGFTGRPTGRRIGDLADGRNKRARGTPKASAAATTVRRVGFKAAYSSFWRCLGSIPMASAACCCDQWRADRRRARFAARFRLMLSKAGRDAMPTRSADGPTQKPHRWGNIAAGQLADEFT